MSHDVPKQSRNPVKSIDFDPFKYGYVVELPSNNTMIQNKILDYAIYNAKESKTGWISDFTLTQLCEYKGVSYSTYHKALQKGPEERIYQIYGDNIQLIKNWSYHAGNVHIKFHDNISKYMIELKEFISFDIQTMFLFKHKTTQLLYKLLYAVGKRKPVRFSLTELKAYLLPGNISKYKQWAEFNRNVLMIAKNEIIKLADDLEIQFDYKPILEGKGGRVSEVEFYVFYADDEIIDINLSSEHNIDVKEIQQILLPEIKINQIEAGKISDILHDIAILNQAKKLYIKTQYVKNPGEWIYYCIFDDWFEKMEHIQNTKEIIGDGMVTYTKNIYYLYQLMLQCIQNNNLSKFITVINRDQISYQISNDAHCFLIKEIMDLMIEYYLGYKMKPQVTKIFAEKMGYNIYAMIDKIQTLKMCNQDYAKNYFKMFEKLVQKKL